VNEHVPPVTAPPEPVPGSAGPLDIAMDAERHDPAPDSPAREVLRKHARLLDEQIALACNERFRNRIKAARDLSLAALAALFALAFAAAAALLLRAASQDAVAIQPLRTPPELAARGLDGTALAARLLDELRMMEAQTRSRRRPSSYVNNWGENIRVEIPNTGLTPGDLTRLVRGWLGKEMAISGEVFRSQEGLTVTVRAGASSGRSFTGREEEIGALVGRAAEAVFEDTQPYRYAAFLLRAGRLEEMTTVLHRLHQTGEPNDQLWARSLLAHMSREAGNLARAEAFSRLVLKSAPWFQYARATQSDVAMLRGHDQRARREARLALQALRSRRWRQMVSDEGRQMHEHLTEAQLARLEGDFASSQAHHAAATLIGLYRTPTEGRVQQASDLATLHQPGAAARLLPSPHSDAAVVRLSLAEPVLPEFSVQAELGDWPAAVRSLARTDAELAAAVGEHPVRRTLIRPYLAYAQAEAGNMPQARALIARTPLDCYRCVRMRGRIAALARDWPDAERWFAEAVRQAPSLPFAHEEWGRARLASGDARGAIRLFREAQERGPRWADPLKYEGDALAALGEHRMAIRKYRQATERAPRWGALHLAWGRSLEALGRREEARAKYAQAARLDLSAADRAAVRRLLVRTRAPAR
jgi:tetratricopeptide (TPR) repeat protein